MAFQRKQRKEKFETEGGLEDNVVQIYRCSKGVPRLVNVIADRCLLACYVMQSRHVDVPIVRRSYQELQGQVLN